ncbi:MAG: phosphoenolpyruvate synthase [uncultured bacterium]|nr:MAG: phosphoenolpyruvate synthase [uncultured bacterium]
MIYIKDFQNLNSSDVSIAGGKGASLGEMTQVGMSVPPGFVILSCAFERFLAETDLNVEIDSILSKVKTAEMHTIENASEKIQALILSADMPSDIASEILENYQKLGSKFVAVRSSATSEDSASAAWAGQLDTFLNIKEENLLENVQKCWASLFTPRAIFYRFELLERGKTQTNAEDHILVAVVVQKMVNSEKSGIAFSVHPVTQDENQLIIEAGFGLGEAIVSGSVTPDSYVVNKKDLLIIDVNVSEQGRALFRQENGGNEWQDLGDRGKDQVLSEKEIIELSKVIVQIEKHYGFPCDIEWAFENGEFFITQSRPITTLLKKISKDVTEEILNTKWVHLGKWIEPALAAETWLDYGVYAQEFFKEKLDKKILYLNGDFFLSEHDSEIFVDESYEAAKNKNKLFFKNIYDLVEKAIAEITEKSKNIKNVVDFLESYKRLTGVWMPLNNIAKGIEKYVQESDPKAFNLTKGFLDNKPMTLQQIDEMYEIKTKIEKNIGRKFIKSTDIPQKFIPMVKEHLKKYEWINTHHFVVNKFTIDNLIEKMGQGKVNNENNFTEKYTDETKYLIWLLDLIGFVRFKAAETSGYTTYQLKDKLDSIARIKGLNYEEIVEHTINEIASNNISKKIAVDRKLNIGFYFDGEEKILTTKQIKICLNKLLKTENVINESVKGLCARSGKVVGIVKVVNHQNQMEGFKDEMVLVSHQTTPDIIFAMNKSSAIVTDFGGLTSHAAIVARELGKPCIVGTKNATKILKDGDLVEVDADNGVVRILEKKQ